MRRTVAELVHVLTEEHASFVEGTLRTEDALIVRLRNAMRASMGMTHGGHSLPNERSALNLGAFTTYEFVTETITSMLSAAQDDVPTRRRPVANLQAWLRIWQLAEHMGELNDAQVLNASRRLTDLVSRIESILNPPRVVEILGACPNPECGERYWFTDTLGSRTSAVYTVLRVGEPLVAHCHWCSTRWEGEAGLEQLNAAMVRQEQAHRALMAGESVIDNATDPTTASDDAGHDHYDRTADPEGHPHG